ncbi:MAG TPA: hypothetical protein ENH01_03135 [Nitrospirae bacterium]|nr:hypothetical protein [Nitrospirota bacterium]
MLTEITNKTSAQEIINKHVFTYNNLDLIDTETITTGTAIDTFTEGLKTYDYNNVNQLLNSTNPAEAFTYDDDGNMTQGYTPDGYQFTATYDAENRLTSLTYNGSINHETKYYYSGDDMLAKVKKYENGSLVSDTRFIRAGFLPIQERDASNAVIREYTWGLNMGGGIGGLLNLNQGGLDYSYLYDGKGNVMAVIDSAESVVASYRYDVFGVLLKKAGTFDQPFRFSTKRYDESLGLSYYGYRFYTPITGRWLTRDPLGEAGGINLYQMTGNNSVNFVDPWGLYGTQSCSYYKQACEINGGPYECKIATVACKSFPSQNTLDCIRQCLQEKHKDRQPEGQCSEEGQTDFSDFTSEHQDCFSGCYQNPENPYDPQGPDLPDGPVTLY